MPKIETTSDEQAAAEGSQKKLLSSRFVRYSSIAGINLAILAAMALLLPLRGNAIKEIETSLPALDLLGTIAVGDNLQLAGKFQEAMDTYQLAAKDPSSKKTSLVYRMALCAEQLGKLNEALDLYSAAAKHDAVEVSLAARLGHARVNHSKGAYDQSEKTLAKMVVASVEAAYSASSIGPEIDFLMARVCSDLSLSRLSSSIRDRDHVFGASPPSSIRQLLQLAPLEGNPVALPTSIGDDTHFGVKLHGKALTPAVTLVSVGLRNQQLSTLLESLSAQTSWKITPSATAHEIISAKRIDVRLRDKTASEMLTLVLGPQGLFWTFENNNVVIDRIENFSPATVIARQAKRANDLLQNVLAEFPNHRLAPYAYLSLGNLAVLEQRFDRAKTFYREIIERFPGHNVEPYADYNMSKVWFVLDDYDQAIDGFYKVVDGGEETELKPVAYLYLGRIYSDRDDLDKSKRALSRGLAIARETDVAATTSLTLAAVYLMTEDDGAAEASNAVLMENREALSDPAHIERAIFLSALTRYRVAFRPGDVRRRTEELTSALMRVDPSRFFGEFGYLLVADAFADVGVPAEAIRVYQKALSRPTTASMRDRLLYRLATEYRKQSMLDLASNTLLELAAGDSETWSPLASIELADMLLDNDELESCNRHCRWALEQGYSEPQNVELLKKLGHVYEELGDHKKAGYCFAGFLPVNDLRVAEAP